jgi:hypothetical protein
LVAIELYFDNPLALQTAHDQFGGAQGLLCRAAQGVADAGCGDHAASSGQSGNDEIRALEAFAAAAGLLMQPAAVQTLLSGNAMRGGKEHRVAYLPDEGRVIKDADVHALATESLYDYLTDILLSNYYFVDDIQILGCYQLNDRLHLVTSQPYVDGTHPDWPELKDGLVKQGLRDPTPRSQGGNFIIDDEAVGDVDVFDLHVNNVIRDKTGWLHPIDAHFYFHDRAARMAVLRSLGLDHITGPTPLISPDPSM